MWSYGGIEVRWLGHDSFLLKGSKTVLLDPFKTRGDQKCDYLLISHEHFDHLSLEDIRRHVSPSTVIIAPEVCKDQLTQLPQQKHWIHPGETKKLEGIRIEGIPAYNVNKFREPGKPFHPKADGRVGYVITLDDVRFYHAGDSDSTPEMHALDVDVAFLPVSGTYVMTAEEAADAAKRMKLKVAVPMHYSSIVGTDSDALKFKELAGAGVRVEILERE